MSEFWQGYMDNIVLSTSYMMKAIEAKLLKLETEKQELQSRLTNLRAYLQGEHSMGGVRISKV